MRLGALVAGVHMASCTSGAYVCRVNKGPEDLRPGRAYDMRSIRRCVHMRSICRCVHMHSICRCVHMHAYAMTDVFANRAEKSNTCTRTHGTHFMRKSTDKLKKLSFTCIVFTYRDMESFTACLSHAANMPRVYLPTRYVCTNVHIHGMKGTHTYTHLG